MTARDDTKAPDPIRSISRLDDPVRRALYEWVVARADASGRAVSTRKPL